MTAAEYLEDLTAVYRRYHYLMEIMRTKRDFLLGTAVQPPVDLKTEIPRYARALARDAIARLESEIPNELREEIERSIARKISGDPVHGWATRAHEDFLAPASDFGRDVLSKDLDIAVGQLETASFNASVIPVPGRKRAWVVALNDGVSGMVYEVARAVVATLNVQIGTTKGVESLSYSAAGRILYERFNYYIHLGVPWGDDYPISREQLLLASRVTTMAERFVYAHELSHVFLNHCDSAPLRALPGDWSNAHHTIHNQAQEIEADLLAWELLTRVFVESGADLQLAFAGSTLFLLVADHLEGTDGLLETGTHPPAQERLRHLRAAAQQTAAHAQISFDRMAMIESGFLNGFRRIVEVSPPLPGPCPLQALLDRTASVPVPGTVGAYVPDYSSFQLEMLPLLSHSAPSKLCRALGYAMAKAELELKQLGLLADQPAADRRAVVNPESMRAGSRPFMRLKLIGGLLWLYLTPEIGRFIERYRDEYLRGVS